MSNRRAGGEEQENVVHIDARGAELEGDLLVPEQARGIVLFAHGSGSSRHSPRNKFVARHLRKDGRLATLLFDLLTAEEDRIDQRTREYRFDIPLLAERLAGATEWLLEQEDVQDLDIGYFGSSTGSAAALIAAADKPQVIGAVVSRGGRVDLAADSLPQVQAPSLFIVGGRDAQVLQMNRQAMDAMNAPVELEVVEGATHLFEEPGALEQVAELAREWFVEQLAGD